MCGSHHHHGECGCGCHDDHRRHKNDCGCSGHGEEEREEQCRCGGHHGHHQEQYHGLHHDRSCGCHHGYDCHCQGEGRGLGFERRFRSRAELIAKLEAYLKELEAEAQGVREHMEELRLGVAQPQA